MDGINKNNKSKMKQSKPQNFGFRFTIADTTRMCIISETIGLTSIGCLWHGGRIGKVWLSRAGDREFGAQLSQTMTYKIDTCRFLAWYSA